jgi:hypothetical protein
LAQCTLDLNHPYFQNSISANDSDLTFHEGLRTLKAKVEAEHTSCNHVVQPMPGYPNCQNKIWKYDWSPPDQRAARRKVWRMVVIVPEPFARPLKLIAAQVYCKGSTDQLTNKRLASILAAITAPVSAELGLPEARLPLFRRVVKSNAKTISVCLDCGETVVESATLEDINGAEGLHQCPGPITA